ncbi:MFS transporter [Actinacidiphila glaucinigra]|uniref:MFS transporter n=1 Tax=Actinacidiphila glaucinigra TaxID=235986 RepID=UPI003D8CE55E
MPTTTDAVTAGRDAREEWAPALRTTVLLVLAGVLVVGQMYTVVALYEPMAHTFHVTPTTVTWTSTAFGFAYAVGFLVAGPPSDRLGARTMITFCLAATALTTALVPLAHNLGTAVVLRVLQGLTAAMFAPAAYAYVSTRIRPRRRAMALSFLSSSLLAAAVIMQIAAQVIAEAFSWQDVFLLSVPLFALLAVAARFVLLPTGTERRTSIKTAFGVMPQLVTRPRLATLYLATSTLLAGFVAIYTALSLTGPSSVAGNPAHLLALRASSLPAMVVIPLLAPVLARLTALTRVITGLGSAALSAIAVAMLSGSPIALALGLLVFVAAITLAAPALVQVISGEAGPNGGSATALYAFAMFAGGSIGGQLVGVLAGMGFSGITLSIAGLLGAGTALAAASARRR